MTIALEAPVFLLGMPRSGTTWLSQIFESAPDFVVRLSPPYSYDLRGRLTEQSDAHDWEEVLGRALHSDDPFMTQNWRRDSGELMAFEKDPEKIRRLAIKDTRFHALYQAGMSVLEEAKTIYIVRHPAAALWSWRNCKEFPKGADFSREWRNGACRKKEGTGEYWGFEDWRSLTLYYLDQAQAQPERYMVVSYEALVADAHKVSEEMFSFCGGDLHPDTVAFIAQSQSLFDPRPYSVFKSKEHKPDWQDAFPPDILAQITTALTGTPLEVYLR